MLKKMVFVVIMLVANVFGYAKVQAGMEVTPLLVIHHENDIEDRLSLKFSAEPECVYMPTKEVARNNNQPIVDERGMKTLRYFLKANPGKNFEKLCKSAAIKRDNYEVSMKYDERKHGIVIIVMFNDSIGFQCERFAGIKGDPTLSFVFVKRNALAAIDRNSKNIFNTAYCGKKKVM